MKVYQAKEMMSRMVQLNQWTYNHFFTEEAEQNAKDILLEFIDPDDLFRIAPYAKMMKSLPESEAECPEREGFGKPDRFKLRKELSEQSKEYLIELDELQQNNPNLSLKLAVIVTGLTPDSYKLTKEAHLRCIKWIENSDVSHKDKVLIGLKVWKAWEKSSFFHFENYKYRKEFSTKLLPIIVSLSQSSPSFIANEINISMKEYGAFVFTIHDDVRMLLDMGRNVLSYDSYIFKSAAFNFIQASRSGRYPDAQVDEVYSLCNELFDFERNHPCQNLIESGDIFYKLLLWGYAKAEWYPDAAERLYDCLSEIDCQSVMPEWCRSICFNFSSGTPLYKKAFAKYEFWANSYISFESYIPDDFFEHSKQFVNSTRLDAVWSGRNADNNIKDDHPIYVYSIENFWSLVEYLCDLHQPIFLKIILFAMENGDERIQKESVDYIQSKFEQFVLCHQEEMVSLLADLGLSIRINFRESKVLTVPVFQQFFKSLKKIDENSASKVKTKMAQRLGHGSRGLERDKWFE